MIQIVLKAKTVLTKKDKERLNLLTLRAGLMWEFFCDHSNSMVVLAVENNIIIGWALVFMPEDDENEYECHIYVSKYRRREGIGTKIMNKVFDVFGFVNVSKWSDEATSFYENFDNTDEIE